MPTYEEWMDEHIILTIWEAPLTGEEVVACFSKIATWVESHADEAHILFDLRDSGSVPGDAPISAVRSGFLTNPNTGRVAVIGMNLVPKILAQIASNATNRDIKFFPDKESAMSYLLGAGD